MTETAKHTPGPWHAKPSMHGKRYKYVQIGKDESYTTLELAPADARLIAAAPDLLEAVKELTDQLALVAKDPINNLWVKQGRAAIAKAGG